MKLHLEGLSVALCQFELALELHTAGIVITLSLLEGLAGGTLCINKSYAHLELALEARQLTRIARRLTPTLFQLLA